MNPFKTQTFIYNIEYLDLFIKKQSFIFGDLYQK